MKLVLLVIATLALVCLSWGMDANNEKKDVKLPGKIELKRIANVWMKTFTIACVYFSFYTCQNCSRWKKIDRFVDPEHLDADSRYFRQKFLIRIGIKIYKIGTCLGRRNRCPLKVERCISVTATTKPGTNQSRPPKFTCYCNNY